MVVQLLSEIDEFVHLSFRDQTMDRQRAGRALVTTALMVLDGKRVQRIHAKVRDVERYHRTKQQGHTGGQTNYSEVQRFFTDLKHDLCREKLGVDLSGLAAGPKEAK